MNSTFASNTASVSDPLNLACASSRFCFDRASGGAINGTNAVSATNASVLSNTASTVDVARGQSFGGGIASGNTVSITASTLSGNTSGGAMGQSGVGGGLTGTATITNSTITGNSALTTGGGCSCAGLTLIYSTVTSNSAATGANVDNGGIPDVLAIFGSVIALPQVGSTNCSNPGTTNSSGYNFSDDASCNLTGTGDRQSAGDPMLAALANNGGPTQTRLPLNGSPLIDAIPGSACQTAPLATGITTDQRSLPRPDSASPACDIGAVEVQPTAPTAVLITPRFTG